MGPSRHFAYPSRSPTYSGASTGVRAGFIPRWPDMQFGQVRLLAPLSLNPIIVDQPHGKHP